MNQFTADRNLLTGILALQTAVISQSQLIVAMQAWVFNKQQSLEDLLLSQGAINDSQKRFLQQLVEQYLSVSGGSPTTALNKLPKDSDLTTSLHSLNDAEISSIVTSLHSRAVNHRLERPGDTQTFRDDDLLNDCRYQVLRPHAQGGLGEVSVAEDLQLHREVALKQIRPEYVNNAESRNRFLVEAEITGCLEHPAIVPVYSLGFSRNQPFYTMRFIRGESLKQAVDGWYRTMPLPSKSDFLLALRKLIQRLIDVGNALSYAHSRGVLHRDVKPSNIMLGRYGETLLVDWGLAKTGSPKPQDAPQDEPIFVPLSGESSTETRMGSVVGTPAYMSPEQASGRLDLLGPHSDVYSLGATLYYILTGHGPFEDSTAQQTLERVRLGDFPEPVQQNPAIPLALNAICKKAMAQSIEHRYASADALIQDLELWLADEPTSAYEEPLIERLTRLAKRHRSAVSAAIAVLLSALVGLGILNWITREQNIALVKATNEATRANAVAKANLETVQDLSMGMLKTAEEKLSDPSFAINPFTRKLRTDLTETAVTTFARVMRQTPPSREMSHQYAELLRISANLQRLDRKFAVANERFIQSIDLQEHAIDNSSTAETIDYLAGTYKDLGVLRRSQGQLTAARQVLEKALALNQQVLAKDPGSMNGLRTLAVIQSEQADLIEDLGMQEEAVKLARQANKTLDQILQSTEARPVDTALALGTRATLVNFLAESGDLQEVQALASATIQQFQASVDKSADDGGIVAPYCRILYWCAKSQMDANVNADESGAHLAEATARLKALTAKTKVASQLYVYASALRFEATYHRIHNNLAKSKASIDESQSSIEALLKATSSPAFLSLFAEIQLERARIELASNNPEAAKQALTHAVESQQSACDGSPEHVPFRKLLVLMQTELASINH